MEGDHLGLYGGDVRSTIGEREAYEDGKRMSERLEARRPEGAAVKEGPNQTLGEAIGTLFGLAGAVGGLLVGGWLTQQGMNGLLAFGGGIVGGFLAGVFLYMAIEGGVSSVYRSFLWRRGRDERDPRTLEAMWEARFGREIEPALLRAVDGNGRGWTMDGRGNFYLRTKGGVEYFIGSKPDGEGGTAEVVEVVRGGRRSGEAAAYHMMLANRSLGRPRVRLSASGKKSARQMWAAAKLVGLEVDGYHPDRKALETLEQMRRDPRYRELDEPSA